jgi:hypothetical protein
VEPAKQTQANAAFNAILLIFIFLTPQQIRYVARQKRVTQSHWVDAEVRNAVGLRH